MEKGTVQEESATSSATPPAESGKVATKQELFMCPECGRSFKNKAFLTWHMSRRCPEILQKEKTQKKTDSEVQIKPEDIAKILEEELAKYLGGNFNQTTLLSTSIVLLVMRRRYLMKYRRRMGGISISKVEVPESEESDRYCHELKVLKYSM